MGYYVRVLSTSAEPVPLATLEAAIASKKLDAALSVEAGAPDQWEQVILRHGDGHDIALIERNVVEEDSLGSEELDEFEEEIADCKPASAVRWLRAYFPRIRCIYAFQLLSGTDHRNGWDILGAVKDAISSSAPSLLQADAEGFSNEEGYHILWQFNDSVEGTWWMGILRDDKWLHFQMDLGNPQHRAAFFNGEVPDGVVLAD